MGGQYLGLIITCVHVGRSAFGLISMSSWWKARVYLAYLHVFMKERYCLWLISAKVHEGRSVFGAYFHRFMNWGQCLGMISMDSWMKGSIRDWFPWIHDVSPVFVAYFYGFTMGDQYLWQTFPCHYNELSVFKVGNSV